METITISQLKAHLSQVIASVRSGKRVTVLDRKTPVAIIERAEPASPIEVARAARSKLTAPASLRRKVKPDPLDILLEDRNRR